jgi:molybdopterin converting factor small subunit
LRISVKFSCPEVLGELKSGVYDAAEGITVRELLAVCEAECNYKVNEKHLKWLLVIADGRQAGWHTILSEGCNVSFLRGALGG